MNWRQPVYLTYASLRGYRFPALLKEYRREYESAMTGEAAEKDLRKLLKHCREKVPYYAELLSETSVRQIDDDPRACLRKLPLLTKDIIRTHFARLQSIDNAGRNCHFNTSGGSTGEPIRLVQDDDYRDASSATSLMSQEMSGCVLGEPQVRLWGSERDLEAGTKSRKARFFNWLTNTIWLNAFQMSPERMRTFVQTFNRVRPQLILAYAQAIYELARFAEREQLKVEPQRAIMTSAGTLFPFMRETIARVFGCEVYNLYGSREVSDMAWELPGTKGLWVAPWANFLEIVDDRGEPVEAGTEGSIVVTSLTNYAMPLLRYSIGDRGALKPQAAADDRSVQFLQHVSGRNVDVFRKRDETLVDGEYFTHLLYFRPWVWKFQVVQKDYDRLLFKVVSTNGKPSRDELDDIAARSRLAMGADCKVNFEFVQ